MPGPEGDAGEGVTDRVGIAMARLVQILGSLQVEALESVVDELARRVEADQGEGRR